MSDPLSPASLAAVPEEVTKAMDAKWEAFKRVMVKLGVREQLWFPEELELATAWDELRLAHQNLVQSATLKAERDRLLALTPEVVVEAAKDAVHAAGAWCGVCAYGESTGEFPGETVGPCADCMMVCRSYVRAALPVLLAPEVAKREQVEREVGRMEQWVAQEKEHIATAEAEVARLRGALEKVVNQTHDFTLAHLKREMFDSLYTIKKIARAALGGADA